MQLEQAELQAHIKSVMKHRMLEEHEPFMTKMIQLHSILQLTHGVMLVGPTGSGKTQAYKVLQEALGLLDKTKGEIYIIDPKAIQKDSLYGKMDPYTLDWQDGIFTSILRKILANQKGESQKRHWIIFDGDVDPEWAENLNSVLDDNKLLTLPNGERLSIPSNVKIIFEVETLKFATLATVSRCGMVWFSQDVLNLDMVFQHFQKRLVRDNYDDHYVAEFKETKDQRVRNQLLNSLEGYFQGPDSVVETCLKLASNYDHVMHFTFMRAIEAFFALVRKSISQVLDY